MLKVGKVWRNSTVVAVAIVAVFSIGCSEKSSTPPLSPAKSKPHWSYEGADGPANWGSLDPSFATCADGSKQTPIDIVNPVPSDLPDPVFAYVPSGAAIVNNGHTIQADASPGSSMNVGGKPYSLLQLHFHAPSEHTIAGNSYPAEVHFVHVANDGNLAVVGVMLSGGGVDNPAWEPFVKGLTTKEGSTTSEQIDWAALYPTNHQTIRYAGSLTTPPCTEGVNWMLMTTPVQLSDAQISAFKAAYSANNRPIEPLNGRPVVIDSSTK
jgi:carbonic anhydrase